MENQRLTKLLDDAHKHIHILRKNNKKQRQDDGIMSVSSSAPTVKAGSSHKITEETSPTAATSPRRRRVFRKLFGREEGRRERSNEVTVAEAPQADTTSCDAVCDERDDKNAIIVGVPPPMSRMNNISKVAASLFRPVGSFDSTEATSRASADPGLAEF